jgi:hypothetical protein
MLRELYPHNPMAVLVATFDRQPSAIYKMAEKLGLKKSPEYLAGPHASRLRRGDEVGVEYRFKPGHPTWNKGMKGLDIGGKHTRFQPGRKPEEALNYRPIGSTRVAKDGYLERKVSDDPAVYPARRWVAVHRLPKPLAQLVQLRGALTKQINKRSKA